MTDYSIFTDAHLKAALQREQAEFNRWASEGHLSLASLIKANHIDPVQAELTRRSAYAQAVQRADK